MATNAPRMMRRIGMMGSATSGRGDMIRTCDSCLPKAVLYQAELHPDNDVFGRSATMRRCVRPNIGD